MQMSASPSRVLVVVDPAAHEQPALQRAAELALRCAGTLELHVCDAERNLPESWAGGARAVELRSLRRRRMLEELERLAAPLRARGLTVDLVCEWQAEP